ncbi:uncharacterized protein LOC126704888 [Quercus robur]|uniref:uncharacterized protein LOC126704888 n=1 Tax=Quercus robur TaxID=38942 RepID=UPI002161E466|nr:uncharacterized protein LOC126704888 [Quercus robur]
MAQTGYGRNSASQGRRKLGLLGRDKKLQEKDRKWTSLSIFFRTVEFIDLELSRFIAAVKLHCKIDKVAGVLETNRPKAKNALYQATINCNGVFGNRGIHINKLAKKTIQTKYGDTYDCMNYSYDLPTKSLHPNLNPSNFWLNGKGCPDGLVPIRRTTKDDLKRAKLATEIHASKYNPLTTDKHGTHDAANGNWRLKVDNDARELGFWPKNIFTALGDGANYVEWGGEVYSPDLPSPPMGSRSSILETTRYDAYCRLIKTFNETDYAVNAVSTKAFSDVNQYQVKDEGDIGEAYFQHLVLFRGPGGYTGS